MNTNINVNEDHLIPVLIEDTVQCLKFFPAKNINYLASGGWDSKLRLYEINYQILNQNSNQEYVKIASQVKETCKHPSQILSLAWKGNTGAIITGCLDGSINYVDCQKNTFTKIGEHQNSCKEVLYVDNYDIILTGGWDGAVKLWDLRANNPITSYQFYNKVYSMSYSKNLFVVALSECVMSYFNLDNLQKNKFEPELIYSSHIKSQIRKVLVLNEGTRYLEGSTEGRIAVKNISFYLKPSLAGDDNYSITNDNDYAFRCHREIKNLGNDKIVQVYPINDMSVNAVYGSVASAGGNGKYTIWDINEKSRVHERDNPDDKTPLTAIDFNNDGNLLAFASGYDWTKGAQFAHLYSRPKIFIHYLQQKERKSKK